MRPLNLKMQAFGAYSGYVEIPFSNLGKSNVYLISGITGSGKTTIFDAICYALFNCASGQYRDVSSLRSHFAKSNVKTFVDFTFFLNGDEYRIIRYLAYQRPKLRGEGLVLEDASAELHLPNGKLINGIKEVNQEIIELLGVNSSQFCQIAMLAQGEFVKLLNASSDVRGEIFRTIFKTQDFSKLAQTLKDKTYEQKNDFEKNKNSILQYLAQVDLSDCECLIKRDEILKNETFVFLNDFLNDFKRKIDLDKNFSNSLKEGILILEKDIFHVEKQINSLNEKNKLISLLNENDKKINEFQDKFEFVKKEYLTLDNKRKQLDDLKIQLDKIRKDFVLKNEISNLEAQLKNEQFEISAYERKIADSKIYLEELKNQHLYCLKHECDNLSDLVKNNQNVFLEFQIEFDNLKNEYNILYNQYLSLQAGILAKDLKENQPCPVCGSLQHPNIAVISTDVITKEELDFKKNSLDDADKRLQTLSKNCMIANEQFKIKVFEFENLKKLYNIDELVLCNENEYKIDIDFVSKIENCMGSISEIENKLNAKKTEIVAITSTINNKKENLSINDVHKIDIQYQEITLSISKVENHILNTEKSYNELNVEISNLKSTQSLLKKQIQEFEIKENLLMDELQNQLIGLEKQKTENSHTYEKIIKTINLNENIFFNLEKAYKKYEICEQKYLQVKKLSDCANGNLKGKIRIAFEQYIQSYYLEMVLIEANKRLKIITNGQYQLVKSSLGDNLKSKTGLDLEVFDFHTFKQRSVKTLSGGESFKCALCLALGLSDCISNMSGAVNIDAIFIDEGFGSLDLNSLELAMNVINSLGQNNRLVGLISHVEDLKTMIDNKIISHKTQSGSFVELTF